LRTRVPSIVSRAAAGAADLVGVALLDLDRVAARQPQVDRRRRAGATNGIRGARAASASP
jgi:hypothetical protein